MVFIDTSAFYAALDGDDHKHHAAKETWNRLFLANASLHTTNYIVVEATALVQRRLGMDAVRVLHNELLALVQLHLVDQEIHAEGVAALLLANRRALSFVDCISFVVLRRLGLQKAFAFDHHFEEQGFRLVTS